MSHLAQVIRPHIEPGRRVVAISDIHGNLPFLKGALDKVGFTPDDVLIIVGDLLEKGRDSLAALRYVLELGKTHTVYTLCGNCDDIALAFLEDRPGMDRHMWRILGHWRERALVSQMAAELGLPAPRGPEDLPALRAALLDRFPEETRFLLNLPTILEAGNFIFVHGGIPREDRLEELENYPLLKNDDFLGQGLSFKKWVIVGHWPVTLYRTDIAQADPIVEHTRHIISIDGGCVLKVDGQLNVLIIPERDREDFSWVSYDGFPTAVALEDQEPSENPINIRWSERQVEVLERGEEFSLCRHPASGREIRILTDYLYETPDGTVCEDSTDYRLPVKAGDTLRVVRRVKGGALVKKDGVTGWYWGRLGD